MINAAQKAGKGLRRAFIEVETLQISKKGPAAYVSEADKRAQKVIFEELRVARPKYGFLMKETGPIIGNDNSNRWIADHLDGRLNFLHGLSHFSVSIALERDQNLFAGVIYEPISDKVFWAEKGQGAWLNGSRIRVSNRHVLQTSIFATGIPCSQEPGQAKYIEQLSKVMAASAGVRRFGAVALDLAYVAAGRFEGFWKQNLNLCEIAGGAIIVQEAGGTVSNLCGTKLAEGQEGIIASNNVTHSKLTELVSGE